MRHVARHRLRSDFDNFTLQVFAARINHPHDVPEAAAARVAEIHAAIA